MSARVERQTRSSTPYNDYLSKAEQLGLVSCPGQEVRTVPPPLTAPSLLSRAGLGERAERRTNTRSDITGNVTGNRNNTAARSDNYHIIVHHQPQHNIEDVFKPMWSWYYGAGGEQPAGTKIGFPGDEDGEMKERQRSNSTSSIDLTEALDPEWYFRERTEPDPRGILKSPGKIKQVGFGKNKVAFLDILGTENKGRQL